TVANFLNYVQSHRYDNTIFHRETTVATDGLAVLQGGGFTFTTGASGTTLPAGTADPAVADQVGAPNTAGTLAMAKTDQPNSATDSFFFNLVDNSNVLSPGQQSNGGFTVFGKLVGDADMNVIQKLSDLNSLTNPGLAIHNFTSPFNSIPLRN